MYTPYLDALQREEWFVIVTNENDQLVTVDVIKQPKRIVRVFECCVSMAWFHCLAACADAL